MENALRGSIDGAPPVGSDVDIWYARCDGLDWDRFERSNLSLLSADEAARYHALTTRNVRREYLATRALLRRILSRYASVEPWRWRFRRTEYGRPEIEAPSGPSPADFNISHSGGTIAIAVARGAGHAVGIDVEGTDRGELARALAGEFMTEEERAALERLHPEHRSRRALQLWTLKEAYAKARGKGLWLPLREISFRIAPHGTARARLAGETSMEQWHFRLIDGGADITSAVAIHTTSDMAPRIGIIRIDPAAT